MTMPDEIRHMDEKYVVFKREDMIAVTDGYITFPESSVLDDAVVIRRQDLFAGPALHTYSNMIGMVSKFSDNQYLLKVADYFHEQAVLADAEGWKLPD